MTLVAGILIWWAIVAIFSVPSFLLPSPPEVAVALVNNRAELAADSWVTLKESLLGLALAVAIGVPLGAAIIFSRPLSRIVYPSVVASQAVPKVALAPILLVWLGYGIMPKVIVAATIAFFPIVITTAAGLASVNEDAVDLVRTMGASKWETFRRVQLPTALPTMMSGFKLAVAMSVVGAVVGEFVGANSGLGYELNTALGNFQVALGFAVLFVLVVMGIVLFYAAVFFERRIAYWPVAGDISEFVRGVSM
ncbi:MAG: ABC transporter permease [Streptosporangiaceae bacterium]